MKPIDFYSPDPIAYVRVALAVETLAYYNKNFLDRTITDNDKISETIQSLLTEAIRLTDENEKNNRKSTIGEGVPR